MSDEPDFTLTPPFEQPDVRLGRLAAALAEARKHFAPITKSKTVKVKTDKGSYEFSYAPFEQIVDATHEALSAQGLSVVQSVDGASMVSHLIHTSGATFSSRVPLILSDKARPQEVGSALTYARRYGYMCLLCLSADDDDDANIASGNQVEVVKDTSRDDIARKGFVAVLRQPATLAALSAQNWNMTALGQPSEVGAMAATKLMQHLLGMAPSTPPTAGEFRVCMAALQDIRDGAAKLSDYGVRT